MVLTSFGQHYKVINNTKVYKNGLKEPFNKLYVLEFSKGKVVELIKKYNNEFFVVKAADYDSVYVQAVDLVEISDKEVESTRHYLVPSLSKTFLYKYPDYGSESIPITSTDTLLLVGYLYTTWTNVEFKGKRYHIPTNHLFSLKTKKRVNEPITLIEPSTDNSKSKTKSSGTIRSSSTYSTKGCSATQCTGTTQKGARCRNRTTNCNGRCYLH